MRRLTRRAFLAGVSLATLGIGLLEQATGGGAVAAGPGEAATGLQRALPARGRTAVDGNETGFAGTVRDLLTGEPVPDAVVCGDEGDVCTRTDPAGTYRLGLGPGAHVLTATAPGYAAEALSYQVASPGRDTRTHFRLLRLNLTPAEEEIAYERLGLQVDAPLPAPSELLLPQVEATGITLPATITVRHESAPGVYTDTVVPLEDYVKGVVPNEVPYTWPAETLKAQAVAARSYGVVSYLANGYVWDDTRSQVYNPANRRTQTDAAVDATRTAVATYQGALAWTFFFGRCNAVTTRDSEKALNWSHCAVAPWNYVAYCRARPCGGHSPYDNGCTNEAAGYYGHGVGMCQWGAYARANEGLDYLAILQRYYTNVVVQGLMPTPLAPANGALVLASGTVGLQWQGTASQYLAELRNGSGTIIATRDWSTATSWTVGPLGVGVFDWHVAARYGSDPTAFYCSWQRLNSVDHIYRLRFPFIPNNASIGG